MLHFAGWNDNPKWDVLRLLVLLSSHSAHRVPQLPFRQTDPQRGAGHGDCSVGTLRFNSRFALAWSKPHWVTRKKTCVPCIGYDLVQRRAYTHDVVQNITHMTLGKILRTLFGSNRGFRKGSMTLESRSLEEALENNWDLSKKILSCTEQGTSCTIHESGPDVNSEAANAHGDDIIFTHWMHVLITSTAMPEMGMILIPCMPTWFIILYGRQHFNDFVPCISRSLNPEEMSFGGLAEPAFIPAPPPPYSRPQTREPVLGMSLDGTYQITTGRYRSMSLKQVLWMWCEEV